jgi:hypothetical protein
MKALASLLLLVLPTTARATDLDLMAAYHAKTQVVKPCDRSGNAIVVCGNRAERNARERLPLPRDPAQSSGIVRGDAPRASAAAVRQGSCGVVGGQAMGCVGGLSVFKVADVLGKSVSAILDPDADLAPPPPLPDRFKGAGQH